MKTGAIVSIVLAVVAAAGLTSVFVNNASPYVTIADLEHQDQRVHVVGQIVPNTLKQRSLDREVLFELKDETGVIPVRYTGPTQSNLDSATQVVVIGSRKDGKFEATQMLVKCPSKYESGEGPKA